MIKNSFGVLLAVVACFGTFTLSVSASTVTGDLNTGLDSNAGNMDGVVIAAPTASPAAGTYISTQNVALAAAGSTSICYSVDGTTPACLNSTTCSAGNLYSGAISISSTKTVKSLACYNNDSAGPMATDTYTINASSGGGGGGGGTSAVSCAAVVYGDWLPSCFGGIQMRNVVSQSPVGCALTTGQQVLRQRTCVVSNSDVNSPIDNTTPSDVTTTPPAQSVVPTAGLNVFVNTERSLVKKVSSTLSKRLTGRILLQVEEKGQAWYVSPVNNLKYFLNRPADAFTIMRQLSLGISNKDFESFKGKAPARLSGRILLKVQDAGKAYYVNPLNLTMHYLGRPADAFNVMRNLGLGITNSNIRQIGVGEVN